MLQETYARFRGGCMMLLQQQGEEAAFRGTAFLVHPGGYLLTAAHLLQGHEGILVAFRDYGGDFAPTESDTITPLPARVCQVDQEHDVALLSFRDDCEVSMPDHVLGMPDLIMPGTSVAIMGYPFAWHHVWNQFMEASVVSAKLLSRNGTKLFLFDAGGVEGVRGGPLVSTGDGRIIGIIGGRFRLDEAGEVDPNAAQGPARVFSYAVSSEYGAALLEKEGVEPI